MPALSRFPACERATVRRVFTEGAMLKADVLGLLLHVSLVSQFELFAPGQYRRLSVWKRLLDLLRDDPEAAAAFARAVLHQAREVAR
jgi:hypothetical protein